MVRVGPLGRYAYAVRYPCEVLFSYATLYVLCMMGGQFVLFVGCDTGMVLLHVFSGWLYGVWVVVMIRLLVGEQ